MRVIETKLQGVFLVEPERFHDVRGFFASTWSKRDFKALGLNPNLAECNISFNNQRGTLRGMHFQIAPHEQVKLVRCTRGSVYDVIIDLRHESPSSKQWVAVELTAEIARRSTSRVGWLMASKRWKTIRKCSIKCRKFMRQNTRGASGGTIRRLESSGPRRTNNSR